MCVMDHFDGQYVMANYYQHCCFPYHFFVPLVVNAAIVNEFLRLARVDKMSSYVSHIFMYSLIC